MNVSINKPTRKDYIHIAVTAADGTDIPETVWRDMVSGVKPRSITRILKHKGFITTGVFDKKEYLESKKNYSLHFNNLVDAAFQVAGVAKEPHLTHTVNTLRPIIESMPLKKAIAMIKNVIKTVHHSEEVMHRGAKAHKNSELKPLFDTVSA
jgi:hypothetical protein